MCQARALITSVKTASTLIHVCVTMGSRDQTVPQKLTSVSLILAILELASMQSIPTDVRATPDILVYIVMLTSTNVSPARAITAHVWTT